MKLNKSLSHWRTISLQGSNQPYALDTKLITMQVCVYGHCLYMKVMKIGKTILDGNGHVQQHVLPLAFYAASLLYTPHS